MTYIVNVTPSNIKMSEHLAFSPKHPCAFIQPHKAERLLTVPQTHITYYTETILIVCIT